MFQPFSMSFLNNPTWFNASLVLKFFLIPILPNLPQNISSQSNMFPSVWSFPCFYDSTPPSFESSCWSLAPSHWIGASFHISLVCGHLNSICSIVSYSSPQVLHTGSSSPVFLYIACLANYVLFIHFHKKNPWFYVWYWVSIGCATSACFVSFLHQSLDLLHLLFPCLILIHSPSVVCILN